MWKKLRKDGKWSQCIAFVLVQCTASRYLGNFFLQASWPCSRPKNRPSRLVSGLLVGVPVLHHGDVLGVIVIVVVVVVVVVVGSSGGRGRGGRASGRGSGGSGGSGRSSRSS